MAAAEWRGSFFPNRLAKLDISLTLFLTLALTSPNLQFYMFNNVAMNGMRASSLRLKYSAGLHLRRLCSQELRN